LINSLSVIDNFDCFGVEETEEAEEAEEVVEGEVIVDETLTVSWCV
jgi:hypothetical protein